MHLIPGTTPTLNISLDISVADCTAMQLCLMCGDIRILRDKAGLSLSEDGKTVSTRLTQAEALLLPDNKIAKIQLRVMLDGAVMATDVMTVAVKELLYRKELMPDDP